MNYQTLKSYFTTACTASSITNFEFGFLYEINFDRDVSYPMAVLIPLPYPISMRSKEFVDMDVEFWILNKWDRDTNTDAREKVWDAIRTLGVTVLTLINANAKLQILDVDNIGAEPFGLGQSVDEVIAIKYTFKLRLYC